MFRSFWQAGFECSSHTLRSGRRLDQVQQSGHDIWLQQDYARLRDFQIHTVREGIRWHLIEAVPGCYDFSSVLPTVQAARTHNIEILWDLFHFGWPDHLNILTPQWVESFAALAGQFAQWLRRQHAEPAFIAPINEISFVSWAGGDVAYLNPFHIRKGKALKRQLVRAYLRAADRVRQELPQVRLISPEPVIHITGNPASPTDLRAAARYRRSMFEAWDMIAGRVQPELGGGEDYLDILGVNYYDRNQWRHRGPALRRTDPEYRPFRDILNEVYRRYGRDLFIAETGTEDADRPAWLEYIADQVRASMQQGTPVRGICLYPILNHPGWDDDRHCHNGLWDYPSADGSRELYQPLAEELRRQIFEKERYVTPTTQHPLTAPSRTGHKGSAVPFPPPVELRLPEAAASDEPLCA